MEQDDLVTLRYIFGEVGKRDKKHILAIMANICTVTLMDVFIKSKIQSLHSKVGLFPQNDMWMFERLLNNKDEVWKYYSNMIYEARNQYGIYGEVINEYQSDFIVVDEEEVYTKHYLDISPIYDNGHTKGKHCLEVTFPPYKPMPEPNKDVAYY
jgi:hypothetical protein